MKNRIVSLILALAMCVSLMPAVALATGPSNPTVEGTVLYANGTALIFEGSGSKTRIFIDQNRNGEKDDVDTQFSDFTGYNAKGNDLYGWTIYGGSKGDYAGETMLTFLGGGVKDVYGGCYQGTLTGETHVTVLGTSTVKGSVYGGSYNTGTTPGVLGNTHVTLGVSGKNKAAQVVGNVFGGGNQSSVCDDPATAGVTEGNTEVTLFGAGARANNVFGGGCGKYATVTGNTTVTSGGQIAAVDAGGATVFGGIYGGGYDPSESDTAAHDAVFPTVGGKATVTMTGGWAGKIVGAGTCAVYENDPDSCVNLLPNLTVREAEITVSGGTVRGGIDAAARMTTANNVTVTGGSIAGTIALGVGKTLTNGTDSVYKATLDVSALLPEPAETELNGFTLALSDSLTYGTNGLVTDAAGRLYFYLPVCTAVAGYLGTYSAANVEMNDDNVFARFNIDPAAHTIYANMNPFKLVSGTTDGYTNIVYDINGDTEINAAELLGMGTDAPTAAGYDLRDYVIDPGFKQFGGAYATSVTMDGGCVKSIKCADAASTAGYTVKAVINDGTILGELNLGCTGSDTGTKTLEINGGSISDVSSSGCPAPADRNGSALYPSTLTLPLLSAVTAVSDDLTLTAGGSAAAYGADDLCTTSAGLLTFWLPAADYTAAYTTTPAESDYTVTVSADGTAPFVFRQTTDALTVASDRVVKNPASPSSVDFTVTNTPTPTGRLNLYTYDGSTYTLSGTVTATLSGTTLTLDASTYEIAADTYYVTITGTDTSGKAKYESEKLALTVADPSPEVTGTTVYTNTLNVKITADAKGTYACVDSNRSGTFEDTEYLLAADGVNKLDITGYNVDATGADAAVTAGTLGTLTARAAVIDGGSIGTVTANTVKNTAGADLYKAAVILDGVSGARRLSASDAPDYDVTGAYTDGGRISFWLPENTEVKSVTAGSTYTGTLTVTADGLAEETFTAVYTGPTGGTTIKNYDVTVSESTHGAVSADQPSAAVGGTVTLTVVPDKGFTLETLTVLDQNGQEVGLTDLGGGQYGFTMPEGAVTVGATFMEDNTMLNYFVDVKAKSYCYDAVLWAAQNKITKGTDAVHFSPNRAATRAQVVTFLWRAAGCPEPVGSAKKFTDVKAGSYYAKAVAWAVEQGITKGTGKTAFSPNAVCTRGEAVTFIARYAGVGDTKTTGAFKDVKNTDFCAAAVQWAKENGVTDGTSATTFSPKQPCTRGQIVTFLYRWMVK